MAALPAASISYAYDDAGRLAAVIDPSQTNGVAVYSYDAAGNITQIQRESTSGVSVVWLSPGSGVVASSVIVYGTGFDASTPSSNVVKFNGTQAGTPTSVTDTQLTVMVPSGATTGTVSVTVGGSTGTSSQSFTVTSASAPTISSLSATVAAPGDTLTVSGSGFSSTASHDVVAVGQSRMAVTTATATSLTVTVPPGATSGKVLVATPDGQATSTSELFVPPPGFSASNVQSTGRMAIGDMNKQVSLTSTSSLGLVVFDATAGQQVFLRIPSSTISLATISIYDPFGQQVGTTTVNTSGGYVDTTKLATTGTYTILVEPLSGSGTVNLSLYDATPITGTITADGTSKAINGFTPGQSATETFPGTSGQRVYLKITSTISSVTVTLLDPEGLTVASTAIGATTGYLDTTTLASTGTYTIKVDPSGAATGNITLNLYTVPADFQGTITPGGTSQTPTTVTIATPGQNGYLTLAGATGQRVSFVFANVSTTMTVTITDPNGSQIFSGTITSVNRFIDTLAMGLSGNYTIKFDPFPNWNTGSVDVYAYAVTDLSTPITIGGPAVTVNVTTPGQNATLPFTGTSGQTLHLQASNVSIASSNISIKNPDGTTLVAPTFVGTTGRTITSPQLTQTGTYTILEDPQGSFTGHITLTLTDPPGSAPAVSTPPRGTRQTTEAQPPSNPLDRKDRGSAIQPAKTEQPALPQFQPGSVERWIPQTGEAGTWFTQRPDSPFAHLRPYRAPVGTNAIAGQVLRLNGLPLAGVTLSAGGHSVTTDSSGRFLLAHVAVGRVVMEIDSTTADRQGASYGSYEVAVNVRRGHTSVLPYTIWSPLLDTRHYVHLTYPLRRSIRITNPLVPGLSINIPAGSTIKTDDGKPVHRLGITPVPLDRAPFPMPRTFPIYFELQPGGVYIAPKGYTVTYPNKTHALPGTRVPFYAYDPDKLGWHRYGIGRVTPDAQHVELTTRGGEYEVTSSAISIGCQSCTPPPLLPQHFHWGDEVDLSSGLLQTEHTDLIEPGTPQLDVTRAYRSDDSTQRAFGIGWSMPYSMFLYNPSIHDYSWADLVFADGSRVHYTRISSGTGYTDAILEADATPGAFYKSRITWNAGLGAWELTLTDDTVYTFGNGAPLQSIRDRFGNQITIFHSNGTYGNITKVISSSGRWLTFAYDVTNRVSSVQDQSGRTVSYTYDSSGRLSTVTDVLGGTTSYGYDASNDLTTATDARGNTYLTSHYDASGRVDQQTYAGAGVYHLSYTVDGSGDVTETDVTDPLGNVRKVQFNGDGYPLTDTAAAGTATSETTTYTYSPGADQLASVTDQLGRRTTFTYDPLGYLTSFTKLAGTTDAATTSLTYDSGAHQVATVTDPLGHTTAFSYTGVGGLASITNALSKVTTFQTNTAGQVTHETDPLLESTSVGYTLGDPTSVADPLGHRSSVFYTNAGNPISSTSATGLRTLATFDPAAEPLTVSDGESNATAFAYDANGNLTSVTDPNGHATSFTYSVVNKVLTERNAIGRTETYSYDSLNRLGSMTDPNGHTTVFSYDANGRVREVGYGASGSPPSQSFTSTTDYSYDLGNRLTKVVDSRDGTTTIGYNGFDEPTEVDSPQGTASYSYDAAGRRATMDVSGASEVSYTYSAVNNLTDISRGSLTASWAYDAAGDPTSVSLPNNVDESITYDADLNPTTITYTAGGNSLGSVDYSYDATSNRVSEGGSLSSLALPAPMAAATYNDANELTSVGIQTYSYDDDGNLASDGRNVYSWNDRDELGSISGAVTASYSYDAFGRRVEKTVGGSATQYVYDGPNPAQEQDGSGTVTTNYLESQAVDGFVSATEGGDTATFLRDAGGNTLGLADSTGTITRSFTYEPFGSVTASGTGADTPYRFAGREDDEGTGLVYVRSRYYSPSLGRFMSPDPSGFASGEVNLYAYASDDPINLTDPFGLEAGAVGLAGDAAIGGVDIAAAMAAWPAIAAGIAFACYVIGPKCYDNFLPFSSTPGNQPGGPPGSGPSEPAPGEPESGGSGGGGGGDQGGGGGGTPPPPGVPAKIWSRIAGNPDITVQEYISQYLKGSINRVFPREWLDEPLVKAVRNGPSIVRKLLTQKEYQK